jgi:hypothetical protein
MAADPNYIASAQITQKTLLPAVLLLGDIAILMDRTETTIPLLCLQSLLADELFTVPLTALFSVVISHYVVWDFFAHLS